jgi:ribosomal protein L22
MEQYLERKAIEDGTAAPVKDQKPAAPPLRQGTMNTDPNALFVPEREVPGWGPELSKQEREQVVAKAEARKAAVEVAEDKKLREMTLDPDPRARVKLQRKLVIKGVKRHGRMTKAQTIARTERQSIYKSHALPTSTKKMQKVINQIAGKTVSEALTQLRFSPKRIARDVAKGLEIAQNEAILARGMGFGKGRQAQKRWEAQRGQGTANVLKGLDATAKLLQPQERPRTIELKDGSKKNVKDPSEIYIDQAWVGKGEMWKTPEFRARGAVNMLRHRTTSEFSSTYATRFMMANATQLLPYFSRRKRHACASQMKSRRSAITASSGQHCPIDPSPHNGNTVYGRTECTISRKHVAICIESIMPKHQVQVSTMYKCVHIHQPHK